MMTAATLFGADLHLLRDLEVQDDRRPGSDLVVAARPSGARPPSPVDLDTLVGVTNLKQALLLRFVTRRGELTALGHPDYGSRLYQLIGELNTPANRNRAKLFALEAIAGEPRIAGVLAIDAQPHPGDRTRIDITLSLQAIGTTTPLNFVIPVNLAGTVGA